MADGARCVCVMGMDQPTLPTAAALTAYSPVVPYPRLVLSHSTVQYHLLLHSPRLVVYA